jgi:hypothetical protein
MARRFAPRSTPQPIIPFESPGFTLVDTLFATTQKDAGDGLGRRIHPAHSLPQESLSSNALPNQRLELAGLPGQGSVDRLMIREAAVEAFHSFLPAGRPQLKRGR